MRKVCAACKIQSEIVRKINCFLKSEGQTPEQFFPFQKKSLKFLGITLTVEKAVFPILR
jgi:hypothetical protein